MMLCAGETTENAIKEDAYEAPHRKQYHSSKHIRPSSDEENVQTNQLEKSSSNEDKERDELNESTKMSQPVSDNEPDTGQPETDTSVDSEEDTHAETASSDDKSEKDEELKDGLEGLFQDYRHANANRKMDVLGFYLCKIPIDKLLLRHSLRVHMKTSTRWQPSLEAVII